MTKVRVEGVGGVALVIVRDGDTKAVVGHEAGQRCTAQHGLEAWDMAANRQFLHGARGHGVSLRRDHGCPPTSMAVRRACAALASQQAFTSDHNPPGKADTERVMRTLKEECLWWQEWTCPFAGVRAVDTWSNDSNPPYLHAALGYTTPRPFEPA
jgi:putative transposase